MNQVQPPARLLMAIAVAVAGGVVALVLLLTSGQSPRAATVARVVHVNGVSTRNYVAESAASGAKFLVPPGALAEQGSAMVDVASPQTANGPGGPGPGGAGHWGTEPVPVTTVVPRSAHVEILATGATGLSVQLGWETTCHGTGQAASGNQGGQGRVTVRSPAVVLVKLPGAPTVGSCYIAAGGWSRARSALRLSVVDY